MMRKLLAVMMFVPMLAQAEAIATMPNEGGGKIVLTDDECKHEGKVYKGLNRVYSYTPQGYNSEGCYMVEDNTVVAIWNSGNKMRYPAENFTLIKKKQPATRYGT